LSDSPPEEVGGAERIAISLLLLSPCSAEKGLYCTAHVMCVFDTIPGISGQRHEKLGLPEVEAGRPFRRRWK